MGDFWAKNWGVCTYRVWKRGFEDEFGISDFSHILGGWAKPHTKFGGATPHPGGAGVFVKWAFGRKVHFFTYFRLYLCRMNFASLGHKRAHVALDVG